MANEIRKGNGQVASVVLATLAVAAVAGWTGFAFGASEGTLSVPDETIGEIGFRVWEYRAATNDDIRTQAVNFKDAAQYRPTGKQKTFDTKVEAGETFVRMGENGRNAFAGGVRPARPFGVRPGVRYTLRFSARCCGGGGMVYLQFLDAKGRNVSDKMPMPKDWTYTPYNTAAYRSCPDVTSNWCEQVLSFLAPQGVSQVLPVVAPWIDGKAKWLDCRSLVLEGAPFRIVREEVRLAARTPAADGSVELVGAEAGLKVKASLVRDGDAYRIAATVSDIAVPPRPRALEVAAEWKRDLVGWTWHRDWRHDETVAKGSSFRVCNNVSGLVVGTYPFTAVSKDGAGVAIGTELDDPAFECGTVTEDGVSSVRALGLLKRGDFGTSADLAWLVLPFRGDWGFRSAAKAYYASQARKIPSVKVGAKEGTRAYLGVSASEMPEDSSDYGLAYFIPNGTAKQRQIAREKGMFAHPYILAWQIPSAHYADYGLIPSMDERLAELQRWLSVTNERAHRNFGTCKRDLAQVLLNSIPLQTDGSRPLSLEWYDGVVHYWRLNVDPRLPEPNACSTFRNQIAGWGLDTIDGVYLDNVYVQQFNNVRPDHLAVMKEPLVFDPETARPCAQAMQHQVAFVKMLADWLHPLDKRVTGNVFHGGAYRFNATIIDVFGCEIGFVGMGKDRSDRLRKPCSDEASCEKRFYAYRRPVADLLQSGNWTTPVEAITAAGITNYVEHHMFYGFYPSVVTIGGEDFPGYRGWKRYFGKSCQCVRDRELFKRAIPLIRRLNRAGWMPETLLRANDPKVMVERYGDPSGECLFTVRNETDKPVDAVLRPSAALSSVTGLTTLWRGGSEVPLKDGAFRVRLAPWSTEVFLASVRPSSASLSFASGAVERTFEIPGYAKVRVVAEGGDATIEVTTGAGGETFAEVKGDGVCTSRCELVEFVSTGAYFGYGWYVAEPGDFTVCANGHHNAVRYAGFDLAGGRSLVVASSFTPMSLYHRTARKVAGYECHGPSTFAFYPGRDGAFACAIRARAFFDALGGGAPGVVAKSDKFCVDTWNGSLAEHGELIRRAADEYGLKDDLFLLVHCWQRYGFDRHLPEVWPPHPAFGTAGDAKATLEIAKARGWLYGPHLNVIDIYSNSNWFAWNKVCHDANGRPVKAWINPYSREQSFRLLHGLAPDSIRYQFGQLESDGFRPSTAFVDVTGGAQQLTDTTWDADGRVHPMTDNVAANARMFDTLREWVARTHGNAAFVSSEAPSDYLAGHLDGGDCQWMCLGHAIDRVYCWTGVGGKGLITKVPWFPLVHHDRLILHGVGYSARFEGGRGELCHGIDSDDYISCEMMLGNEPMADCYNRDARDAEARIFRPLDMDRCLRQVVRKYWLEQPVSKELAMARVRSAGFVDGNPEHVFVAWSTGLTVKVNRGERDWTVDGHVLPQYGYRAWNPKTGTESKIYRHACGRVVEESAYRDGAKTVRYASARGLPVPNFTPVEPRTSAVRTGARVKVTTDWTALAGERAPSGDWQVAYWLADPKFKESNPKSLMRRVATVVSPLVGRTEAAFDFPDDVKGRVSLLVSVSPAGADVEEPSGRLHLLGTAAFYRRFTQGFFGKDGAYEVYECPDRTLWDRLPAPKASVDFGWTKTIDGVRTVFESGKARETKNLPRIANHGLRE